jgi:dTDP-4-amino-4,6-dideoxygalactose transaminase
MQIIHAGCTPKFQDVKWTGVYALDPLEIVDGAGRFTSNMYLGGEVLQTLSFQIKKRLPIGKGGAILTNSKKAYDWLKLASYDGRDLNSPYSSRAHIKSLGWHFYMTPEDAARGILIMDQLADVLPDTMSWKNYPDLLEYDFNL